MAKPVTRMKNSEVVRALLNAAEEFDQRADHYAKRESETPNAEATPEEIDKLNGMKSYYAKEGKEERDKAMACRIAADFMTR